MHIRTTSVALAVVMLSVGRVFAAPSLTDPANLLVGLADDPAHFGVSSYFHNGNVTTAYGAQAGDYGPQNATDTESGPGGDFVFETTDSQQRFGLTGFNSALSTVRIWTGDLRPLRVTLKSSTTSKTSINASDYETLLISVPSLAGSWVQSGSGYYADFTVSAPAGTQSLFADFGAGQDTNGNTGFARITEVQAFVPEPGSLGVVAGATMFLFRRRRSV